MKKNTNGNIELDNADQEVLRDIIGAILSQTPELTSKILDVEGASKFISSYHNLRNTNTEPAS